MCRRQASRETSGSATGRKAQHAHTWHRFYGFSYADKLAELGPTALDSRFGMDDTFQLPRELRLTFRFEF